MVKISTKALVLAAVASACGYASAATISTTSKYEGNVSLEGAVNSTAKIELNNVLVTMGAFQSRDSIIQLQLTNGARFLSGTVTKPSVSCTSGNIVLDIGAPASSATTWDFGITGTSGTTSDVVCTFASLQMVRSSLSTAGVVGISSGVKRTSDSLYTYDTSAAATILTVQSQIVSVAVSTAFNGTVDYQSKSGYGFVANDGAGKGDQMQIVVKTRDLELSLTSAMSVNFVVSAESGKSFSFLDAESCGVSGRTPVLDGRSTALGLVTSTGTGSPTVTINSTCTTLTYAATPTLTGLSTSVYYFGMELGTQSTTPSTGVVIEPMTFPAFTATVSQGATARATASITPGTWTSNGATVVIPYMPINLSAGTSAIDPVVSIANRSALTGTLTGSMRDEDGNSCTLDNLGTVGATRTKSLGGLIKTAFAACSNLSQTSTEKMYITITATLPDSTTVFYSGYTVGGSSRVSVINSTNGRP
ncbi:MAG: hypothetical protein FJ184_09455 [Gammaproteobacteria bacterium]|nr:hypothetical protein [Gammaproteobacteria bacterium]